jgi:hypothetical protein
MHVLNDAIVPDLKKATDWARKQNPRYDYRTIQAVSAV